MKSPESPKSNRALVARVFTVIEDIVYIGLLLAGSALVLLVSGMSNFGQNLFAGLIE